MPDAAHLLSRTASRRIRSSRETICRTMQCLIRNRHVIDQMTARHQMRTPDSVNARPDGRTRHASVVEHGTAQLWLSRQLLRIADELIQASRCRRMRRLTWIPAAQPRGVA